MDVVVATAEDEIGVVEMVEKVEEEVEGVKEDGEKVVLNDDSEEPSDEFPDWNWRPMGPERQMFEPALRLLQLGSLRPGLKPKKAPRE